jgi:hypothetical protein
MLQVPKDKPNSKLTFETSKGNKDSNLHITANTNALARFRINSYGLNSSTDMTDNKDGSCCQDFLFEI